MQRDGARPWGQMDLAVGVVAGQPKARGAPEGEGAGQGAWAALMGQVEVAGGSRGGDRGVGREQLAVHSSRQGCVSAEMGQELLGVGEALVTRTPG